MAKRMLIDATHPEETRVVVLNGNRLEEFDFESSTKKQVKGNIYLAKVTRVEPSLQAAFVDYSNHRHGFLAFSEIHPDYYKIPVGDREPNSADSVNDEVETQEAETEAAGEDGVSLVAALPEPVPLPATPDGNEDEPLEAAEAEARERPDPSPHEVEAIGGNEPPAVGVFPETPFIDDAPPEMPWETAPLQPEAAEKDTTTAIPLLGASDNWNDPAAVPGEPDGEAKGNSTFETAPANAVPIATASVGVDEVIAPAGEFQSEPAPPDTFAAPDQGAPVALLETEGEIVEAVETLGGDEFEEAEHQRSRTIRHYKIQEVI